MEDMDRLRRYIPAAVLPHITISSKVWAGELRRVSVVFANLGIAVSKLNKLNKQTLNDIQKIVEAVQRSVYEYEGSLNKFLIDDKGTYSFLIGFSSLANSGSTLVAVFGLPPLAHENDPVRAILSCIKMQGELKRVGLKSSIGVTSGLALCGLIGAGARREYTVLGDVVNLSARLMQAANGGNSTTKWMQF